MIITTDGLNSSILKKSPTKKLRTIYYFLFIRRMLKQNEEFKNEETSKDVPGVDERGTC